MFVRAARQGGQLEDPLGGVLVELGDGGGALRGDGVEGGADGHVRIKSDPRVTFRQLHVAGNLSVVKSKVLLAPSLELAMRQAALHLDQLFARLDCPGEHRTAVSG